MPNTRLNPEELVNRIAAKAGVAPEQVRAVLQAQSELACEYAAVDFPIPGVGLLTMIDRPARKLVMRFGPRQGQEITVPAKKVLKFRVSKITKDVVFAQKPTSVPDIFDPHLLDVAWYPPDEAPED